MKLLKFSADWCSSCVILSQNLAALTDISVEKIEVDIDQNPSLAEQYGIRGLPTLIVLDNDGNELSRKVGALSAPQIQQWLDSYK